MGGLELNFSMTFHFQNIIFMFYISGEVVVGVKWIPKKILHHVNSLYTMALKENRSSHQNL